MESVSPPKPEISTTSDASPKKSRKRLSVIITLGILVLLGGSVAAYLWTKKDATSPAMAGKASLMLYYRDGKTVLWDSAKDELNGVAAPGFVASVKKGLQDRYGDKYLDGKQWTVTTTLDTGLQKAAQEQIKAQQSVFAQQNIKDGALIAEDVTNGQIVSWVGRLENSEKVTDAVTQKVEVGTLALPLTYAAAIEHTNKYGAGTVLNDTQGPIEGYPCTERGAPPKANNCLQNFDFRYIGQLTLRQALGSLRLVPAVKTGETVGFTKLTSHTNKLVDGGSSFGCYSDVQHVTKAPCYGAAAIGAGLFATPQDIIQAYATVAEGGKKFPQSSLLKVVIDNQADYLWEQPKAEQVLRPDTAYIINDILADPTASYLANRAIFMVNGSKVSVVSGITTDAVTGSAVQYSDKYVVGFWAFGENGRTTQVFAETATQPVVTGWLSAAHSSRPGQERSKPKNIKVLPAPVITFTGPGGQVGPSPSADLFPAWYK